MHPSWAAKRQQQAKIDIAQPAAKKLKFNERGEPQQPQQKQQQEGGKRSLHPSWAAKKQQQAPAIGSFAGKKKTFDD